MLFIILQILLTQAQQNQTNFLYLFNQSALEIQVTLHSHLHQPFILASSNKQFENIYYVEGQDKIQSLNYDHESFITNNDVHVIFTESAIDLYIYAGYLNQSYNQYSNFSILIQNRSGECSSFCIQQGNTCNSINKQCLCKSGYFGKFCQLQRTIAVLQTQYDIIIKPLEWIYIGFETKQLNLNDTLKLRIRDQSSEMLMGLGMEGIENHDVPNVHYDAYMIPKKIQQQIYQLKGDLIYYQQMCENCSFLNIGFYNQHSYPILFYFELYDKEQLLESDPYHLQIIFQSIFLTFFILITYLIFRKIRQKQQREQIRLVQREFRVNRRRRRMQQQQNEDILKGFNLEFIQTYFPQFYYLDLIDKYPQLSEFVECVVCLESMAPPQQGKLTERDHIDHCSLTPCYHLFHQHCLFKWLQTQKCCPLCRKEFIEQNIKSKPWISFNNDISLRETSRVNPFVQRMKTRSENTQQSDIPLMVDTESVETQPNKDITVNLAQKSARDLIIR
ncbi:unnamed protein product [Paramecium octaurelia]|uniref:RING-type domain-containing protein n=1 Tax=Paramecium octaurelia TaxID=43137 RepID=A0A8S1Y5Q7_PAROT|nr:unnamed protein product [Paramecium octaurelia]